MEATVKEYEDIKHACKSCGEIWTVRMLLVGGPIITLPTYTGLDTYLCPKCNSRNTIMFSKRVEVEP